MIKCALIYGTDPAIIQRDGKKADAYTVLQFAQSANPGYYWTLYEGFWYGTQTCLPPGSDNFPGALSYTVNENIYIYNGQIYDLTLFLTGGCDNT